MTPRSCLQPTWGLFFYQIHDSSYQRVILEPEETEERYLAVRDVYEETPGVYWLATATGLLHWDAFNGVVTRSSLPDSLQESVSRIVVDAMQRMWLSFANQGLVVWDRTKNTHHQFVSDFPLDAERVTRVGPVSMRFDHLGDLWMGRINGIWKLTLRDNGIDWFTIIDDPLDQRNNVRAFGLHDEEVLISTSGGVFRQTRSGFTPLRFKLGDLEYPLTGITFHFDLSGSILTSVATPEAIGMFQSKDGRQAFERFEAGDIIPRAFVSEIQRDQKYDHRLWLGTYYGLGNLDMTTREVTWYKPIDDHQQLPQNNIKYLVQETPDVLWTYFMGASAIGRFDRTTERFEIIRPPAEQAHVLEGTLTSFQLDDNHDIWITSSYGLTRFRISDHTFDFYTTDDGLAENKLINAIPDELGNLWVLGSTTITQFRPDEGFYRHFDVTADLRRLNQAAAMGPHGEVYIGGANGYYRINPETISRDTTAPRVVLTDFKVSDRSFDIGQPAEEAHQIEISYRENIITFEFLGIHFLQPDQNKYRCKLDGFDPEWRELGKERKATYTNLDPGTYTFRVEASNADGVWTTDGLTVDLEVTPAIWQTNWFKAGMIAIALVILYLVYRNRQRQLALKRDKEIAETSARYKSQFLANISHEIRTPMNAIVGMSKLMQDTEMNYKQGNYVHAIRESSENLVSIINDLLDHSKIESGQFTFVQKPFDLDVSLRQVCTTLGFKAEEKGLQLLTHIDPNVPLQLEGDPVRLNQILINLAGNAIKFTDTGSVTMRVSKESDSNGSVRLTFEVADTGVGIPEEKLSRIFDSFTQADDDTFVKYGGTGLGLTISRQLVEQQSGTMQVFSTVGKGTTFAFTLPFKEGVESGEPITATAGRQLKDLNILVVEDTLFNQMLAQEILQKHIPGVKVEMADNGQIGLEKVSERDYDLVLMDIKMPVMNGYEATRAIRALTEPKKRQVPILGLSASAVPEHIQKYLAAGMNDCVTKPINTEELLQKMQNILESVTS